LAGDAVEQLRLVLWINRADRHAINAFGNEVFDDALLPGSRAITGHLELDCYIGQFGGSLLCPLARNRPEVRRVVGDKGQPQFLVATFFASVASGNAESQADDQCAGQTTTKPCSHKNVPPDLEFGIRDGRDCKQTSAKSNLSALTSCVNKQKGCSAFDRIPVLIRSEVRDKDLSLLLLSEHECGVRYAAWRTDVALYFAASCRCRLAHRFPEWWRSTIVLHQLRLLGSDAAYREMAANSVAPLLFGLIERLIGSAE